MVTVTVKNILKKKLKEIKLEQGITKSWIAEQLGISKQNLENYCKAQKPNIEIIEAIAYLTGCEAKDFYEVEIDIW